MITRTPTERFAEVAMCDARKKGQDAVAILVNAQPVNWLQTCAMVEELVTMATYAAATRGLR